MRAYNRPRLARSPGRAADRLEELWEQACTGEAPQIADAYRQICDLLRIHANESAVYVRLYWLLRVAPELDSQHSAPDWLLAGLVRLPEIRELRDAYLAEVDRDPSLVFRPELQTLIESDLLDTGALEELLVAHAGVRRSIWIVPA